MEWQKEAAERKYTWEDAGRYCEELSLAGHEDWRLPSWEELKSLVVCSNTTPTPLKDYPDHPYYCGDGTEEEYAIPTIDQERFTNTVAWYYWSADVPNEAEAWALHFGVGGANKGVVRTAEVHVRCVRDAGQKGNGNGEGAAE